MRAMGGMSLRLVIKGLEPLLVNPGIVSGVQTMVDSKLRDHAVPPVLPRQRGWPNMPQHGRAASDHSKGRAGVLAEHSPFLGGRRGVGGRSIEMVVPGN